MNISTSFHIGTKPPKKPPTNIYLTMHEKQAVIKEINLTALFLLEYYLSVIARENYLITDKKTSTATGLSLRTVQDNRRLLEKHNLFCVLKTTGNDMTSYLYCARKEGVYRMKYFDKLFGYNNIRDVYWNYTKKEVADILVKKNMTPMETKDIMGLLVHCHDKRVKSGKHNCSW